MEQDSLEQQVGAAPYADVAERLRHAMAVKNIRGSDLASRLRDPENPKDTLTPQAVSKWTTGKGLPDEHRLPCSEIGAQH